MAESGMKREGAITTIIIPWCAYQFNDVVIGPRLDISQKYIALKMQKISQDICQIAKAYLVVRVQNYARGTKEVKFSLFQARIISPLQRDRHRPCSRSRGTSFFRSLLGCRSTKNFSNNNEQDTILTQAINYTIPLLHFYAPQSSGRGCLPIVQRARCVHANAKRLLLCIITPVDNV